MSTRQNRYKKLSLFFLICFLALGNGANSSAKTLWFDQFDDRKLDEKNYKYTNGKWLEENGVLKQTDKATGDPTHAIILIPDPPEELTIEAKMRVDFWVEDVWARAGVAVRIDPATSQGLNFLFHTDHKTVQFLDDLRAWLSQAKFEWEDGKWYWLQMHVKGDTIQGKAWAGDIADEPKKWLLEERRPGREKGSPALNGGSNSGGVGKALMSFDEVSVWDSGGPTHARGSTLVAPGGKLSLSWGAIKANFK